MFYMRDVGWGWEFLAVVGMVAFWALVILGVMLLVRGRISERTTTTAHGTGPAAPTTPAESAIDILDRRLATGDISIEEYRERREAIERTGSGVSASV
jgi:putative membrane protein